MEDLQWSFAIEPFHITENSFSVIGGIFVTSDNVIGVVVWSCKVVHLAKEKYCMHWEYNRQRD